MIFEQLVIVSILVLAIVSFIRSRFRFDLVALLVLGAISLTGILSPEQLFAGFSHPAVIVVASMFVISQALVNSGVIDVLIRKLSILRNHPFIQLTVLMTIITFLSAFINNVGALVMIMPIAIDLAKKNKLSPALFLMPLAFASHLGGYLTLIGTPRNILISTFRQEAVGEPFAMFDFFYVGAGVALAGLVFLTVLAPRLLPNRKKSLSFSVPAVEEYTTEVSVPDEPKYLIEHLNDLRSKVKQPIYVIALMRQGEKMVNPSGLVELKPGDTMLVKASPEVLTELVELNKLQIVGQRAIEQNVSGDEETKDLETVLSTNSLLSGKAWSDIGMRLRFGVNLLGFSRYGEVVKSHLDDIVFKPGDVLLLRGRRDSLDEAVAALSLLPLAERGLTFGRPVRSWVALLVFVTSILLASFSGFSVAVIFLLTAVVMVLLDLVSLRQAYDSIDWSVLILIGSMITLGLALEVSGVAQTLSNFILSFNASLTPVLMLALIMVLAMLMADFVNTTASVVVMAPVAILVANGFGLSIDPFLMAVAIGGSSAFLTPVAHESNTLVLGPGGYKFGDYWKVGLPLEIIIVAVSLPLLLYFWPF